MFNFKLKLLSLNFYYLNCTAKAKTSTTSVLSCNTHKLKPFNYAKNSYT